MKSIGNMLKLCSGLIDTNDVSEFENVFLTNVYEKTNEGKDTTRLSEKQIAIIERIYGKHFA